MFGMDRYVQIINTDCRKSEGSPTDEYLYCEKCGAFVYEYCSIHGPYLIIPDDKVSSKPKFPPIVPRAALTIPSVFLHLAPSRIPGAGIGVFSTLTLPRAVRFGPYRGKRTDEIQSKYCWQMYENKKPRHVVDAVDPNNSNWMRYVNCARHWQEQNLIAYQYKGQLYYRTIKLIPAFTELLVFYGVEYANTLNIDLRNYNTKQPTISTYINTEAILEMKENSYHTSDSQMIFENGIADYFEVNKCDIFENTQNNAPKKEKMENKTWECDICNRVLSKKTRRREHYSTHIIKFKCGLCPYKTKIEIQYRRHVEIHTQANHYACDICYFLTTTKDNLNRHKKRLHIL